MKKLTVTAIGIAAAGAVAVPTYALADSGSDGRISASQADGTAALRAGQEIERHRNCHGGAAELSVEKKRHGFEIDAALDHSRPYSVWSMTLRHDGKVIAKRTNHRTDDEGEMDLERNRPNTRGKDVFKLTVKPKHKSACTLTVRTR